ncbi:Uncharacterized protein Rs2_35669 [Raphanus sativus]|nr:Uncharacterized protein Rs2_35669 [Raphanus sativus]
MDDNKKSLLHKFRVKVSDYNFTAKRQTLTVSKFVCPAVIPALTPTVDTPTNVANISHEKPATSKMINSFVDTNSLAGSSGEASATSKDSDDNMEAKRCRHTT